MFSFFKRDPKPYDTGFIPVGDGHELYYQQFGNPNGAVVLSFHGGPGGSGRAKHVTRYDLTRWRVILFDQRGCGLSKSKDAFLNNTTQAIVSDGMKILDALKVKGKITVAGSSFGSSLALLFAEVYPNRVKRLLVNSIFLMRNQDIDWVDCQSRMFYPDLIDEMRQQAKSTNLVPFYHKLIFSDKYKDLQQALKYFGSYERALGKLDPSFEKTPALTDGAIRSFQIYMHYEKNRFFVKENQILNDIGRIRNIPTLIVHNRLDMICPVDEAYDLHKAMPKSRLIIVPDIGHGTPMLYRYLGKELQSIKE